MLTLPFNPRAGKDALATALSLFRAGWAQSRSAELRGHTLKPAFYDLRQRRPVWEALSDMFLDTDVTRTRHWRVRTLAASPYSMAELEQILIDEVYPICHANLWGVAGVWAGFDQYWLERRILLRLRSPLRVLHGLNLGRITIPRSTEWRLTKQGIGEYRQQQDPTDLYSRRQGSRNLP